MRQNISIHTLRVEGDLLQVFYNLFRTISIHTLRVEGDASVIASVTLSAYISIHTLRVEGDRL